MRKYYEFCAMFDLKQLKEVPVRVTCSSSTIIDHILARFFDLIEFHSKVSLIWDCLNTSVFTALKKSQNQKRYAQAN